MAISTRAPYHWQLRTRSLALGERTHVMGIVNVTPDSFSDDGAFPTVDAALHHALRLLDDGADILDIGGESTRPGSAAGTADALSAQDEQQRVLPVIEAILKARPDTILSIDTYRASTATAALQRGVEIVNDVSGMHWDTGMAEVSARFGCGIVAMHTRGLPSAWATQPPLPPQDILPMIMSALHGTAETLYRWGCSSNRIVLDPGFGFGKRGDENWLLLHKFHQLQQLGYPLLAGLSRKGFLRRAAPAASMSREDLDQATATANAIAALGGAHIVRVHDVARTVRALAVADTTMRASANDERT
jgi:dihydropteroate synthase